ncbi:hypothetical protein [Streptococcus dysgalactiae]|uniref:hypothetical protein n=1 Tax=Streptococcus dysgalactiae TaxID=1334 RepID=UPI00194DFAD7|nr:hypothetical protein [Streptococcus dysgalactiae]MBM6549356.1 hypothetical protein [Streptococcus dysgalactiae subsp. equisimilis]
MMKRSSTDLPYEFPEANGANTLLPGKSTPSPRCHSFVDEEEFDEAKLELESAQLEIEAAEAIKRAADAKRRAADALRRKRMTECSNSPKLLDSIGEVRTAFKVLENVDQTAKVDSEEPGVPLKLETTELQRYVDMNQLARHLNRLELPNVSYLILVGHLCSISRSSVNLKNR